MAQLCLLKPFTILWRNSLINFFLQGLKYFKFYHNLFMLESVHIQREVHALSILFHFWHTHESFIWFFIIMVILFSLYLRQHFVCCLILSVFSNSSRLIQGMRFSVLNIGFNRNHTFGPVWLHILFILFKQKWNNYIIPCIFPFIIFLLIRLYFSEYYQWENYHMFSNAITDLFNKWF